ncbi:MAG: ABC transporter ATP-binding protein [Polyangiales bacterium]
MTDTRFLEISQVSKTFETKKGPQTVVEGFDLRIAEGEFVSVVGHSGCGKSTVLSMVAGLASPTHGGIVLAGREVTEPGPDRGVVFQAPCLLPWMTALENVLLGIDQVKPRATKKEKRDIAAHYLGLVGLGEALDKRPAELSQGMRQRVGLARAFALAPKCLLLDEPFGMLDSITRMELQEVLLGIWAEHRITAVMVTHDVDEAILLSDRVVLMTNGPHAHVGEIVSVPFERPRDRHVLLEDSAFYEVRERLIGFLEGQGHHGPPPSTPGNGSVTLPASPVVADA